MSQRLAQMTEEALETGGRQGRKAVAEAGLNENLRKQFEERIASASFRQKHAQAFAQAALPQSAGRGTRDVAGSRPWTGTETVEDAALRMLTDVHKPLRIGGRSRSSGDSGSSGSARPPTRVDTGRVLRSGAQTSGTRLANARDRSSVYSMMKDAEMGEKEKEAYRRELKERFTPTARSLPATLTGLASLANERIEEAIARGQFKNLPRGQKLDRDYNMSSPFIETTEYFMNKIIQKQDLAPPWIEKQQELVSTASKFRARLRNDWRRHASRLIASKGGTLDEQLARAHAFAKAEAITNPPRKRMLLSAVDGASEHMSQISRSGKLMTTRVSDPCAAVADTPLHVKLSRPSDDMQGESSAREADTAVVPPPPPEPLPSPFRDLAWESNENSYLTLTINTLNSMTRSYNLMAPDLAKKPYFSLERELRACYADVAPTLADAIRQSALAPKPRSYDLQSGLGRRANQLLDRYSGGGGPTVRVRDEEEERYDGTKPYGLKQLWRDLWAPPRT